MSHTRAMLRRIELNYGAAQSSYWLSMGAFSGFMALYLGFRGYNDTQIGLIASLISVLTISFQLLISSFSDRRPDLPLKRTIALVYIVAILLAVGMLALPMELGILFIVYALGGGLLNTINGLLNALMMQYVNIGLPVRYGLPRGMASIAYAFFSLLLGLLIEAYSPSLLMPLFLVVAALGVMSVMLMPDVYTLSDQPVSAFTRERSLGHRSYRQLLKSSPIFSLFLIATVVIYMGAAGCLLFLVRVIEGAGGGSRELGIGMFIQAAVELPTMLLSARIFKRFKAQDLLSLSFFFYVVRALLLALSTSVGMVYAALSLNIFCYGIYCVGSVLFVNGLLGPGEKVRAQGLVALGSSLGGILSSLFSGMLLDSLGLKPMLMISTAVSVIGFLLMLRCRQLAHKAEKGFDSPSLA